MQNMLGMNVGEKRQWEFTFPQDWNVELWRGQLAVAHVTLVELFSYILPEVRFRAAQGLGEESF
jgi:FKBP-type peptidyl-prolyl cis-trans isomerase (trigger factor)